MPKDDLQLLRELTVSLLQGAAGHAITARPQDNEALVIAECRRIKKMWSGLLFGQANDKTIKRYIQFMQQGLLELSDELYYAIDKHIPAATPASDEPFLVSSQVLLEGLLGLNQFLYQYFYSYGNAHLNLPVAALTGAREKMRATAAQTIAALQGVTMDRQLEAVILDYLTDLDITDKNPSLTEHSLYYRLTFAKSTRMAVMGESGRDRTDTVVETLIYLNFNHSGFCRWYVKAITAKKDLLMPAEQVLLLEKQLLLLKTTPVGTTTSYDPAIQPVNILLEDWLNEAIRQLQTYRDFSAGDHPDKVELKLTVAQLALLIRLLYEEGVFAMKNIAGLLRFFSRHFISKKQAHISYGSMNKLYYSGDQFTGYAVRDLLLRMVAKINKMFFPV